MTGNRNGTLAFWAGLLVALLVLAVFVAGGTNQEPLDPRSTSDDGAKGLVDLLTSFGGDVHLGVSRPDGGHDVAVLLADTYGFADREALQDWVREGGRLLVADADSPLTPRIATDGSSRGGSCGVRALDSVTEIVGARVQYREPSGGQLCFDGVVAVDPVGSGVIVSIGSPDPLLNAHLADADNAVLAVSVLVPVAGTRVAVLEPRLPVGEAGENLVDLVPKSLWVLLIQLGVGFVLVAWWQARRLGAPVPEPALVAIEGSELAVARGRLLSGMRQPGAAAAELRLDTRRQLLRRLGLPAEAPVEVIARQIAPLAGQAVSDVVALLETGPIVNDAELAALADGLAALRRALFEPGHVRASALDTSPSEGAAP